jgi:hypothetical protein
MRATPSSRVLAGALAFALVASSGCATVSSTGRTQRGQLLRSTPQAAQVSPGASRLVVSSSGQASVVRDVQTCTPLVDEYQVMSVQSRSGGVSNDGILNLLMIGGGGAALAIGNDSSDDTLQPVLMAGGGVLALVGLIGLATGDFTEPDTDELVPTQQVEKQVRQDCSTGTVQVTEALPWRLTLIDRFERTGTTSPSGLSLGPVLTDLIRGSNWGDAELRQLFSSSVMPIRLTIGDAPSQSLSAKGTAVPDSVFAPIAERYEARLSGDDRARWDNCKVIAHSHRETFECFFSQ